MPPTRHHLRLTTWRRLAVVALAISAVSCASASDGRSSGVDATPSSTSSTTSTPASAPDSIAANATSLPTGSLTVEVMTTIDHDPDSFTQGLVRTGEGFFESIGLYGQSALLELDESGAEIRRQSVDDELFAEGLELVDDQLVQLTYEAGTALIYDADSFAEIGRFSYEGEGWGLCRLGDELVMSDGSATLTRRAPDDFAPIGTVTVTLDDEPLDQLNELECVDGTVWANVWQQDIIVGIDPATGAVHSVVDASGLLDPEVAAGADVLNGIAHDPAQGTFWLTGKNWPALFEVRFVAAG